VRSQLAQFVNTSPETSSILLSGWKAPKTVAGRHFCVGNFRT
jgi:hypothetical protein